MERELWPRLYHLVMEVGESLRLVDVTFQPHLILLVLFWAALHDRPVCWACDERNWTTTTLHPATLPSEATMSRRLRRVDTAMLLRAVVAKVREEGDETSVALIDGKPLPVGGASGDPAARRGRGAGMFAKGYKLFAVRGGRPPASIQDFATSIPATGGTHCVPRTPRLASLCRRERRSDGPLTL